MRAVDRVVRGLAVMAAVGASGCGSVDPSCEPYGDDSTSVGVSDTHVFHVRACGDAKAALVREERSSGRRDVVRTYTKPGWWVSYPRDQLGGDGGLRYTPTVFGAIGDRALVGNAVDAPSDVQPSLELSVVASSGAEERLERGLGAGPVISEGVIYWTGGRVLQRGLHAEEDVAPAPSGKLIAALASAGSVTWFASGCVDEPAGDPSKTSPCEPLLSRIDGAKVTEIRGPWSAREDGRAAQLRLAARADRAYLAVARTVFSVDVASGTGREHGSRANPVRALAATPRGVVVCDGGLVHLTDAGREEPIPLPAEAAGDGDCRDVTWSRGELFVTILRVRRSGKAGVGMVETRVRRLAFAE